jgi:hypothetical protein
VLDRQAENLNERRASTSLFIAGEFGGLLRKASTHPKFLRSTFVAANIVLILLLHGSFCLRVFAL